MPQLAAKKAVVQAGERLDEMAENASRLTSSVSEAVQDNLHRVRRTAKRSWYGVQDVLDDAAEVHSAHPNIAFRSDLFDPSGDS